MAATIKIKRGGGTPSGLTFGEPAYDTTNSKLFIGLTSGSVWVGAEIDNDSAFTANSAVKLATQQATKAYVDAAVSASGTNNFAFIAVSGQSGITADVSGDVLTFAAGTGITLTTGDGSADTVTIGNTGVISITGTSNEIEVSGTGTVQIGLPNDVTIGNNLTVTGNLIVNGNTTTVNSNVTTVDDPMFLIGTSGGVPIAASDGGKDRGIAFTYYDSTGKTGFFGLDATDNRFKYFPDATISSDTVSSGSVGEAQFKTLFLTTDGTNTGGLTLATLTGSRTYTLPDHTGTVVAPTNLGTSGYILKANGTTSQPTWIDASSAGFTAYAATRLASAVTISLGSDLSGSASFDGSGNITINATIAANSVTLGTDTTGQYASTIASSGSGLSITTPNGDDATAYTIALAKINSGIDFGTFAFTANEFTNNGSGTVALGVVDGGSY